MRTCCAMVLSWVYVAAGAARADEPEDSPRPVPLTRPEMKQLIEDVKERRPRIPLPEVTDQERAALGEGSGNYESRVRYHYLPWVAERRGRVANAAPGRREGAGVRTGREQDPAMILDNTFKVELFWIVSRVNNCQYCLGHQESKLLAAGLGEEDIATLDGDWSLHKPAERSAFAFARKLTYEPHLIKDADLDGLREHFTDMQILEMVLSVAGNNSINRWKEAVGVPQRRDEGGYSRVTEGPVASERPLPRGTYLTPTPEKYRDTVSRVAPVVLDESTGEPTNRTVSRRPPLESRQEVEEALAARRQRTARLPLVDEAKAREVVSEDWPKGPLPSWVRLLANFPRAGMSRIVEIRGAEEKGDLTPLLKAQLGWIIARHDRAWYAAGEAMHRLRKLGLSNDQIYTLDGNWEGFAPAERALFNVARKLAASPVVLTDSDVARAVELAGPRDVVQVIHYTTTRALFNRLTEAGGLPLEE